MKKLFFVNIALAAVLLFSAGLFTGCDMITTREEVQEQEAAGGASVTEPIAGAEEHEQSLIDPDWALDYANGDGGVLPNIADVVAKVKPSVVAINTEIESFDIFNRPYTQQGAGSGFIISEDGIIVTNNHVIEGATLITVTMDDGEVYNVDLKDVASDELTDMAVLKIDATGLPAVELGKSTALRVGDWVVAIGNSLGERISATSGIVSAQDVVLTVSTMQTLYHLVQTDAAINPGNSGGPLVNMAGEVIGITSVKIAEVGVEGMGYAISTEVAVPIIEELINNGYVIRPFLGVRLYPQLIDAALVQRYGLGVSEGAVVTEVIEGSPADKAGLEVLDIITMFGGQPIAYYEDLLRAIRTSEPGETVTLIYWRGETVHQVDVTLAESEPPDVTQ